MNKYNSHSHSKVFAFTQRRHKKNIKNVFIQRLFIEKKSDAAARTFKKRKCPKLAKMAEAHNASRQRGPADHGRQVAHNSLLRCLRLRDNTPQCSAVPSDVPPTGHSPGCYCLNAKPYQPYY